MSGISLQAFIGEGVTLGERVTIGPFAVILGPCTIEDDVVIGPGTQIGAPPEISSLPQNPAWEGDLQHEGVIIRRGAVIREGVVIHQGSHRATTVGADSWILNRAYLAHDVLVGEHTTVSAGVSIGGHCVIGNRVNIGMNASLHQRRIVASGSMIGMGTPLTADVPPFAKVFGSPARLTGVNAVGMQRSGYDEASISSLVTCYSGGELLLDRVPDELSSLAAEIRWWQSLTPSKPIKVRTQ